MTFVIVTAWWILVYSVMLSAYKTYVNAKSMVKTVAEWLMGMMTDDISKFLWYIVGPILFLIYLLCMLLHTDKQSAWILIFLTTPIAD